MFNKIEMASVPDEFREQSTEEVRCWEILGSVGMARQSIEEWDGTADKIPDLLQRIREQLTDIESCTQSLESRCIARRLQAAAAALIDADRESCIREAHERDEKYRKEHEFDVYVH